MKIIQLLLSRAVSNGFLRSRGPQGCKGNRDCNGNVVVFSGTTENLPGPTSLRSPFQPQVCKDVPGMCGERVRLKKDEGAWDFLKIGGPQASWVYRDYGGIMGPILHRSERLMTLRGIVMGDSKRVVLNSRLGSC